MVALDRSTFRSLRCFLKTENEKMLKQLAKDRKDASTLNVGIGEESVKVHGESRQLIINTFIQPLSSE
jgi:uncharacterized protein YjfI (DUF2170 family)